MEQLRLKAMAKVNLGLDVVRKREDGYHEVKMIMQTLYLYDQLFLKKSRKPGIRLYTNLPFIPANENNLVYKAVKMIIDEFQIEEGIEIELKKHIPVAAGMAGGSSDAAAALYGMNRMFRLGLSKKQLMERGVNIGADVPYCIMRGTALSEGIGELLTPLSPFPSCYILIAKPGINISTKYVYENLDMNAIIIHPDIEGMAKAIEEGDLKKIACKMENVLETVTAKEYKVIEEIKEEMKKWGALNAIMSGSGPTVFGLFNEIQKAKKAYSYLKAGHLARHVYLTTPFNILK